MRRPLDSFSKLFETDAVLSESLLWAIKDAMLVPMVIAKVDPFDSYAPHLRRIAKATRVRPRKSVNLITKIDLVIQILY